MVSAARPVGPPHVSSSDPRETGEIATKPLRSLAILVVEDDDDTRELLAELLTHAGAHVLTACDVPSAFAALQKAVPDLILSDIGMPGEDGYSFMRRLRAQEAQHGGRIPAVALTAFQRPEDRERAASAGFDGHLGKPVRPKELLLFLRSLAVSKLAASPL